ncbi:MAG: 2OG-Fe(II) oxygenase [Gammaproteobacteria bacterium]
MSVLSSEPHEVDLTSRHIAARIMQYGWCVYPDFLPEELVAELREQSLSAWRAGQFRHAGIGRGQGFEIKPQVRNDQVRWLEPEQCHGALTGYFAALENLRKTLNKTLYLGLFDYEAHLAIYPPGSFYNKHLDQFRGIGVRTLTATFYLNDHWQADDGGQLRLYLNGDDPENYTDILPTAGTLVCFLSSEYLHEVLPSRRERLSITGWFRQRPS